MNLKNISYYVNLRARDLAKLLITYPYYHFKIRSGTRYVEKKIHDYRLLIDLKDEGISKQLMLLETREEDHIIILNRELSKGMVAFDLGANIGYYSAMMANLVGTNGKVYAVEPSSSNFQLLSLNLKLNQLENIVETYNIGISNKTGMDNFYESEKSNWHTFYPKVHSGIETESLVDRTPIQVPVMTISEFAKGKRKIDLIRMDIEGFEVEVFESLLPLLKDKSFGPKILFEVHQPRYNDKEHNMRKVLKSLFENGYHVKTLASNQYNRGGREIFENRGYKPSMVIKTDFLKRGIYDTVADDDAIYFMCDTDFTRAALLERN
ncbi:MAG: FkbM family methyltransferase [bacterium]|nr:FkbM family methyltransferase [bacterium]